MDTDEFTAAATNPTAVSAVAATEGVKESPSTKTDDVAKAPSPIRTRRQLAALSQPTTSTAAASTKPAQEELPPPSPIIPVEHKRLEDLLERLVDKTKNSNVHALEKIHVALTQVRVCVHVNPEYHSRNWLRENGDENARFYPFRIYLDRRTNRRTLSRVLTESPVPD